MEAKTRTQQLETLELNNLIKQARSGNLQSAALVANNITAQFAETNQDRERKIRSAVVMMNTYVDRFHWGVEIDSIGEPVVVVSDPTLVKGGEMGPSSSKGV